MAGLDHTLRSRSALKNRKEKSSQPPSRPARAFSMCSQFELKVGPGFSGDALSLAAISVR